MKSGTHDVVVWVGTKKGETHLFTITARNAQGNTARMLEVEAQAAAAGFVVHHRETGLTKEQANETKAALKAQYKKKYTYQSRNALPLPMKSWHLTRAGANHDR